MDTVKDIDINFDRDRDRYRYRYRCRYIDMHIDTDTDVYTHCSPGQFCGNLSVVSSVDNRPTKRAQVYCVHTQNTVHNVYTYICVYLHTHTHKCTVHTHTQGHKS